MTTPEPKIVLIAITKHGAGQVKSLAEKLPEADIVVSEKFSSIMTGLSNNVRAYQAPFAIKFHHYLLITTNWFFWCH